MGLGPDGSLHVQGQVTPSSSRFLRKRSSASPVLSPNRANGSSLWRSTSAWRLGISAVHGAHQKPKKDRTVTFPRVSFREISSPSTELPVKSGATFPIARKRNAKTIPSASLRSPSPRVG